MWSLLFRSVLRATNETKMSPWCHLNIRCKQFDRNYSLFPRTTWKISEITPKALGLAKSLTIKSVLVSLFLLSVFKFSSYPKSL